MKYRAVYRWTILTLVSAAVFSQMACYRRPASTFATIPVRGIEIRSDGPTRLSTGGDAYRFRIRTYRTNLKSPSASERDDVAHLVQFDLTRRVALAAAVPLSRDARLVSRTWSVNDWTAMGLLTVMPETVPPIEMTNGGIAVKQYTAAVDPKRLAALSDERSEAWKAVVHSDASQAMRAWDTMAGAYENGRKAALSAEAETRFRAAKRHLNSWYRCMIALDAFYSGEPVQWPTENEIHVATAVAMARLAALYASGNPDEAATMAKTIALPDVHLLSARYHLIVGDPDRAAHDLDQALKMDSQFAAAHALMAEVQDRLARPVLAEHHRDRARQLAPHRYTDGRPSVSFASKSIDSVRFTQAQNAVLDLIRERRLSTAQSLVSELISRSPSDWRNYLLSGWAHSELGQHADAIAAFVHGHRLQPRRIFLYNIGLNAAWQKDYARCITYLRRYLDEADQHAGPRSNAALRMRFRALHFIGAAHMNMDQHAEAVIWSRQALGIQDHYLVWRNLGLSLKHLGHLDDARHALYQSMALKPSATARRALADLKTLP